MTEEKETKINWKGGLIGLFLFSSIGIIGYTAYNLNYMTAGMC